MDMQRIVLLAAAAQRARDGSAKQIRERAGISMAEVARAVGVGQSAVSRWENGQRQPRGEAAIRWAALLVDLDRRTRAIARR